jgi:beta-galactosidase
MPESMQRYDAYILKNEIGVNAVRTSHYPQSHYFIDECDKIGLLVFTEIPGWQHIGGKEWQDQAVRNVYDMVTQYRNHTSIILWGVRINESEDNDEFYARTNGMCHLMDPARQTGGVRCRTADKNTNILEDVFTYNDFVHSGDNQGCLKKEKSTNDMNKGYLVTEYNGHMYPTKKYDAEEHRLSHTLRHANVLNAVSEEDNIAGSFAWCMFDYNTHKDFGSGDRICYHGVCDMFRNLKSAAYIYSAEGLEKPILEVTSTMDIGEHPACNRGDVYIISNADSVRMYKSDKLLKEYFPKDSRYKGLKHGPILIDDFIGDGLVEEEHMSRDQAAITKRLLNRYSINKGKMTAGMIWDAIRLILIYHMSPAEAIPLYQKYIGNWGGESIEYRFDAIKNNTVVRSKIEAPMHSVHMDVKTSDNVLHDGATYDVAEIRVFACDENENVLPFYNDPLIIHTEGPIELIGPEVISFEGGMTGIYVRTTGEEGDCSVILQSQNTPPIVKKFKVEKRSF